MRRFLHLLLFVSFFLSTDSHSESQWDHIFSRLNSTPSSCPSENSEKDTLCGASAQQFCNLAYQHVYTEGETQDRFFAFTNKKNGSQTMIELYQNVRALSEELGKIAEKTKKTKANPQAEPNYDPARPLLKKHIESLAKMEEAVLEFTQLPSDATSQIFEDSKKNLLAQLTGPKKAKLEKIRLVKASDLLKSFDQQKTSDLVLFVQRHFLRCGSNTLLSNAVYGREDNYLIVCPGLYLSSIDKKNAFDASGLYFTIGHELGHSIDAKDFKDDYKKLLGCIRRNDVLPERRKAPLYQIRERISSDAYEKSSKATASSFSSEYWKRLQQSSLKLQTLNQQLLDKEAKQILDTQQNELIGDYYGTKNLSARILKESPADSAAIILKNMVVFCDKEMNQFSFVDPHPTEQYRIETLLRNPDIRKKLGCTPVPTQKPWCD